MENSQIKFSGINKPERKTELISFRVTKSLKQSLEAAAERLALLNPDKRITVSSMLEEDAREKYGVKISLLERI